MGFLDVPVHLGDERVHGGEFALIPQTSDKLQPDILPVEVAVEVKDIGLDQRMIGLVMELGPNSDIDGSAIARAVNPYPAGVDAIGRQDLLDGIFDVGSREAELTAAPVPMHNRAMQTVTMPQQGASIADVANGDQFPNLG